MQACRVLKVIQEKDQVSKGNKGGAKLKLVLVLRFFSYFCYMVLELFLNTALQFSLYLCRFPPEHSFTFVSEEEKKPSYCSNPSTLGYSVQHLCYCADRYYSQFSLSSIYTPGKPKVPT